MLPINLIINKSNKLPEKDVNSCVGLLSFSVILYTKLQNKGQYLEVALDVGESCTRGRHDGQDTTDSTAPAPLHHFGGGGFPRLVL